MCYQQGPKCSRNCRQGCVGAPRSQQAARPRAGADLLRFRVQLGGVRFDTVFMMFSRW